MKRMIFATLVLFVTISAETVGMPTSPTGKRAIFSCSELGAAKARAYAEYHRELKLWAANKRKDLPKLISRDFLRLVDQVCEAEKAEQRSLTSNGPKVPINFHGSQ